MKVGRWIRKKMIFLNVNKNSLEGLWILHFDFSLASCLPAVASAKVGHLGFLDL